MKKCNLIYRKLLFTLFIVYKNPYNLLVFRQIGKKIKKF